MIFQMSPKLSVARDLPQTYRQTVPQTRPCNSKASITKSVVLRKSFRAVQCTDNRDLIVGVFWKRLQLRALSVSYGLTRNFVAVYLTFVQFILQLKVCLYTIAHYLLEELKISLKSSLSTQWLCHTISPRVGVGSLILGPKSDSEFRIFGVAVGVPQKNKDSSSLTDTGKTHKNKEKYKTCGLVVSADPRQGGSGWLQTLNGIFFVSKDLLVKFSYENPITVFTWSF